MFIVKLASKLYGCTIENKKDWRKIALFVGKNSLNSSKSHTLKSNSSATPTKIDVNKTSNKRLWLTPLLNLNNFPNINNKIQNTIIRNDFNNSFVKLLSNKLSPNLVNPKLFHIFFWFHLLLAHIFKKKTNEININIYSLPIKNGKKDEKNKTGKIPKV